MRGCATHHVKSDADSHVTRPSSRYPAFVTWRVKFDGECAQCGIALRAGEVAVWDRATRSMHCVECPTAVSPLEAGTAGASARREYERRVATRDARITERFGTGLVSKFVRAVAEEPQSTRAWDIGARGEEKLASELAKVAGIRMLHDRRRPGSRANIDHIVIAPSGVFVVDAKRYRGLIQIRNRGWFFRPDYRLTIGGRDKSSIARGMAPQVATVETAIARVGMELPPITPVLCFIDGEWPLISAPDEFEGVRLESPSSLRRLLVAATLLDERAIDHLHQVLARELPAQR